MLIVAFLLCLVKNFFVVDEAFPFFLADLQKGDNGVFIVYRILRCCKPKCNAEMFAGFTNGNFFQKHTGLRAGVPDDVIGILDNFSFRSSKSLCVSTSLECSVKKNLIALIYFSVASVSF